MAQAYKAETGSEGQRPEGLRGRMRLAGRRTAAPGGGRLAGMWRRGIVLAVLALALAGLMVVHAHVPNRVGNLGSLLETFLPWLGVFVPVLLVLALVRRSATALLALVLPVAVWLNLFGGLVLGHDQSRGDLTVVTHNVNAENGDLPGTVRTLVGSGAQLLALEELTEQAVPRYASALKATYPYHVTKGTVGLWSKYPLRGTKPVDLELGWERALRTTAETPKGPVAVFVAHLPSVRVKLDTGFVAGQRDRSTEALGEAIREEPLTNKLLVGDLNGTMNDRALSPVTSQLRSTQGAAGKGFGFSWPAGFPMARIDQILVGGAEPVSSWTLPRTGSDHLPVAASIRLATTS
ncbi:membrane protein [Streptomyces sp. SPB074]|nr:endonuclease/exonuclease/phosphatase family protein [Streptomyces sp. SPB074]EDY43852.1 membrane protein [Streptomyces sp. SPB074]